MTPMSASRTQSRACLGPVDQLSLSSQQWKYASSSGRVHEMSVPSPVNESLLSQRLGALGSARSWAPNVLPELEHFIRTADDYDLFRVNPIQYGGALDLSEADAIELFVHAAKVGLFEMDWLLICAYCPQVAGSFRELDQVHPRFQCAFCNRDQ